MDFRNYIPPDGGHVGCGIWQSRSLIRDSGSKSNKWTKERLCGGEYVDRLTDSVNMISNVQMTPWH